MKGSFQIVAWNETEKQNIEEGLKLAVAEVKQHYSGDIQGSSEIHYQLFYSQNGNAHFVGFEIITISNRTASLTLQHTGRFTNGIASSDFIVIHSTLTSIPVGSTGHFDSTDGGKANYVFI